MRSPVLASAVPVTFSAKATGQSVVVPSDTEEDNTEDEASAASTAQPAQESLNVAETPSLDSNDMPAGGEGSNKTVLGTPAQYLKGEMGGGTFLYKGSSKTLIIHSSLCHFAFGGLARIRCNNCLKQHVMQCCLIHRCKACSDPDWQSHCSFEG